jgi:DNA polymerase-3 subunit alpha
VPALPDDRKANGTMEKETLGLFLSSHPLKEVRPALRARVDCPLSALAAKKDGEWVTVGGVIAECKRIRTKKGDPMMFATLDDLEAQVEMLVFNSAYAKNEDKVAVDAVVLVRGRVDHKERGETKLVAQEVEVFQPSADEVEEAALAATAEPVIRRLLLNVEGGVPGTFIDDLKDVCKHFPGDHEVLLLVGQRSLLLGNDFRVSATSDCRAELGALDGATLTPWQAPPKRESSRSAVSAAPSATVSSTQPGA